MKTLIALTQRFLTTGTGVSVALNADRSSRAELQALQQEVLE